MMALNVQKQQHPQINGQLNKIQFDQIKQQPQLHQTYRTWNKSCHCGYDVYELYD